VELRGFEPLTSCMPYKNLSYRKCGPIWLYQQL
jgi:hypothetical protein